MLFLSFQVGTGRYALKASRVVEVLPLVKFQTIPGAPASVAGVFDYRGVPVPAVDLGQLFNGKASPELFTTRIIIIRHPDASGESRHLGLVAENVTSVFRKEEHEFYSSGPALADNPYLDSMLLDESGVMGRLREDYLLPQAVRDAAFSMS